MKMPLATSSRLYDPDLCRPGNGHCETAHQRSPRAFPRTPLCQTPRRFAYLPRTRGVGSSRHPPRTRLVYPAHHAIPADHARHRQRGPRAVRGRARSSLAPSRSRSRTPRTIRSSSPRPARRRSGPRCGCRRCSTAMRTPATITDAIARQFPAARRRAWPRSRTRPGNASGSRTSGPCASAAGCGSVPAGSPPGTPTRSASNSILALPSAPGTHPTTALCLEWLDGRDLRGRALVDYGCGSGILAHRGAEAGCRLAPTPSTSIRRRSSRRGRTPRGTASESGAHRKRRAGAARGVGGRAGRKHPCRTPGRPGARGSRRPFAPAVRSRSRGCSSNRSTP